MSKKSDLGTSRLSNHVVFFAIGTIAAIFCGYLLGWKNPTFIILMIAILLWFVKLALDLRRWSTTDVALRPPMAFPKKTFWGLFFVVAVIGLSLIWIDNEFSKANWR